MTDELKGVAFTYPGVTFPGHITLLAFPDWPSNLSRVEMRDEEVAKYAPLKTGSDWEQVAQAYRTLTSRRMIWKFGRDVIESYSGLADPDLISDSDAEAIATYEADCLKACSLTAKEGGEIEALRAAQRAHYLRRPKSKDL